MSWEYILLEKKDGVATVTLNRPEKYNAFAGRMRQEIVEVIGDVAEDRRVRAVVITGAGKAFCVGGDVNEFVSLSASTDESELALDVDEGSVSNLGGGINMNGEVIKEAGKFDVGVVLAETGLGGDDVQDITFTLDADTDLTLEDVSLQDFGLRLTSVGEPDGPREGSLKLGGESEEPVIEEPEGVNIANNDFFVVDEDEGFNTDGSFDFNILANDEAELEGTTTAYDGQVTSAQGSGESQTVAEDAIIVPGTNGGLLMVYPDGSVDFSANGEFNELAELEQVQTTFEYEIEGGDLATIIVQIDGIGDGGGEGGGGEEPEDPGDFLF